MQKKSVSPAREIHLNQEAIRAIKKAAEIFGIEYEECKTWTTDGFYRKTKEMVMYRKEEGCKVVEMECSALTASASFRDAIFG
jgi:purine-nucleoside phosphorylase